VDAAATADAPAVLGLTPDGINNEDVLTRQIRESLVTYAGAITGTPVAGLKKRFLRQEHKDSQLVDGFMPNLSVRKA